MITKRLGGGWGNICGRVGCGKVESKILKIIFKIA